MKPTAIAVWIDYVVPCMANGRQSVEVSELITAYLRRQRVPDPVITAAMAKSNYSFTFRTSPRTPVYTPQQDYMDPAPPVDKAKRAFKMQDLEQKYLFAMAQGNAPLARAIIKALIDLLGGGGEPFHDMEKEKERLEELRLEIEQNAPNAGRKIRVRGGGSGPPVPLLSGARLRPIGPYTYEVDVEAVEGEAAEAEGEREAD
jgi:hypothetical protein